MTTPVCGHARLAVFGGIPWQRCQFHLQQNAQAYVPRKEMLSEVAEDIRPSSMVPNRATAEDYLAKAVEKYQKTASRLAEWMALNIPEGLMIFSFWTAHRRLIRTTNGVERLHREVRRRARGGQYLSEPNFLLAPGFGCAGRDE